MNNSCAYSEGEFAADKHHKHRFWLVYSVCIFTRQILLISLQ
jgi:hypothetical protein